MSPFTATASPSYHAALHYFVLSHLNLERDAASLYKPRDIRPDWVTPLLNAYRAAPGRLGVHFAPLRVSDIIALFGWLERPPPQMHTPADRALCDALYGALEGEAAAFEERWNATCADAARIAEVTRALIELKAVMTALWARRDREPPALIVLDAPDLGGRARGWLSAGRQCVATSLTEPLEHVLCQVLHEAIHPVSDLEVGLAGRPTRDTHAEGLGYETHRALELAAVKLGAELVEGHAPSLTSAYQAWSRHVGLPVTPTEACDE